MNRADEHGIENLRFRDQFISLKAKTKRRRNGNYN